MMDCPICGKHHKTEYAYHVDYSVCKFRELLKNEPKWQSEGCTTDFISVEPDDPLYPKVRAFIWSTIAWNIYWRDEYHCTDCGIDLKAPMQFLTYEAHHIIPRCKGGTEHPANLRTLCSKCHRKYTNELLGEIAIGRKTEKMLTFLATNPPLERYCEEVPSRNR